MMTMPCPTSHVWQRTDMDVVHAWNSMSYGEGFLFSLWVIGMYYIKLRMDRYFTR